MYHFETIHTIGWALILNGITHALLVSRYDFRREVHRIIRSYWILSAAVLILTPLIWTLTSQMFPGYPFETNPVTGKQWYMPYFGKSPGMDHVIFFFINPLAAPHEPLFPYLAKQLLEEYDKWKDHPHCPSKDNLRAGTYLGDYPTIVKIATQLYLKGSISA